MKKILLIIAMLWGVAHAQTIGYLRYDTVKVMKNGGRGSLDVTGNVRFTGLLAKSAGTDSVVVRDVNGNLGTTAKSAIAGADWSLTGNSGTTAGTNFIGTTDSIDFVGKTKGLERFRWNARGALGLGTGTDYGTSGYLMKSNGASTAPSWVDPTDYLKTIYNSDGTIDTDRYVDGFAGGEGLYFGKLTPFGQFEIRSEIFDAINSSLFRVTANDSIVFSSNIIHLADTSISGTSATNGYVWTLVDDTDGEGTWKPSTGGGGSGTVNSGTQYRLGYYATTGTAISEAAAITANRALISDANGVPTHSTTTATQLGYLNAATGTTGTTSTNLVFSASPTFTGTITGAAATLSGLLKVADGTAAAPTITATSNTNTGISFYNGSGSAGDQMKVSASTLGAVMSVQNTNGSGYSGIEYLNNSGTTQVFTGLYIPTNEFRFNNIGTSGTIAFKIASNNALVVNNNLSLTAAFYGAGTATFDASGNITSVSDSRLKTNIKPYRSGVDELMKLRTITYQWNDKSGMETKGTYAGFSAQNVKDAIPLGTGENKDGYLSLQERAIIATLVNVAQEQQREIEKLKKEIKKLKRK